MPKKKLLFIENEKPQDTTAKNVEAVTETRVFGPVLSKARHIPENTQKSRDL